MPNKKALIVGINNYGSAMNNLFSCVNDSNKISELLSERYKFDPRNIRKIQDKNATLDNIQKELRWLFQDAQTGDNLVFYFSGHGHRRQKDGSLKECLVSSDGNYFYDDEFSQSTQSLPPGILSVIIDSCHSGGMEKSFVPPGEARIRIKAWTPPTEEELSKSSMAEANPQLDYQPFGLFAIHSNLSFTQLASSNNFNSLISQSTDKKVNGLFIAACQPNEKALSDTRKTEELSVFTFGLLQSITHQGTKISNKTLFSDIKQKVQDIIQDYNQEKGTNFKQVPLLIEPLKPQGLSDLSFITFEAAD